MQSAFRAYLASIAAGIPVLLSTQFPVEILALHHLILAFPEWPNTPLPAPDPPLPPYTPTRHSAASKLDPASYRWKPKPPAPVVATVYPTNALLQSVHAQFRPVLQSLHDVLHALGHFLHLSLPALDDTSNSALNTPQSVLSAVRRQQRFLNPWLTARVHYLAQRASMVETCIKYGWEVRGARQHRSTDCPTQRSDTHQPLLQFPASPLPASTCADDGRCHCFLRVRSGITSLR